MTDKDSTLIFFTETFPFGHGETFIENEIPFLANSFGRVIIVAGNMHDKQTRSVPEGVQVIRRHYAPRRKYKLLAGTKLLNTDIREEIKFIRQSLKLIPRGRVLSLLLAAYAKGLEIRDFLDKLVEDEKINTSKLFLYAYWMNDFAAAIAMYRQQRPEVTAVCRAHRWDIYLDIHSPEYLPLRPYMLQRLNACYSISQHGADYLKQFVTGAAVQNIKVAKLGTVREEAGIARGNTEKLSLVSCSLIIPRKRIELIIEALRLVKHTEISWTHLGDGPEGEEIKKLAAASLTQPNIRFQFTGAMSNSAIHDYYSKYPIDLLINVSQSEGVPVSIMEAYSYGIPAIATNTGGVNEVVNDKNGFLIDVNSTPQAIATIIEKYAALSDNTKQQYRQQAYDMWNTHYNADKNYRAFIADVLQLSKK